MNRVSHGKIVSFHGVPVLLGKVLRFLIDQLSEVEEGRQYFQEIWEKMRVDMFGGVESEASDSDIVEHSQIIAKFTTDPGRLGVKNG